MLKRLLEQYDSFIAFMNLPENRWLVRGKLAALLQYCVRQVQMRDAFIEKCKAVPADISRTSILKRGLAVYFSREEKISAVFLMKLVQDLKKNCQELNSLATRYDKALPREAMTVRELIMQKGIPGDSTVRRVWATK